MKKNILLSILFLTVLFLSSNMTPAFAHDGVKPPMPPHQNHPPKQIVKHHPQRLPMYNHNMHHLRHYYGFSRPYYYSYFDVNYPAHYVVPRIYHPMNHGHFGATIHINL